MPLTIYVFILKWWHKIIELRTNEIIHLFICSFIDLLAFLLCNLFISFYLVLFKLTKMIQASLIQENFKILFKSFQKTCKLMQYINWKKIKVRSNLFLGVRKKWLKVHASELNENKNILNFQSKVGEFLSLFLMFKMIIAKAMQACMPLV